MTILKSFFYYIASLALSFVGLNHAFAQGRNDSPATQFVLSYGNEFTFGACVLVLILSCWLSVKLPTDDSVKPELSTQAKILSAVIGGVLAFIFSLHRDKGLTLMNPVWIFVTSLSFPVTILTLRSKFKQYTESIDLNRNQRNKGD